MTTIRLIKLRKGFKKVSAIADIRGNESTVIFKSKDNEQVKKFMEAKGI